MDRNFSDKAKEIKIREDVIQHIAAIRGNILQNNTGYINISKFIFDKYQTNNLSGVDLSNIDFSYCYLDYLNLSFCNLTNCNFAKASLFNSNLNSADISNANFKNCKLISTNMANTKLRKNDFKGALVHFVDFSKCTLNKIDFSKSDVTEPNFTQARLNKVNLSSLDLNKTCFARSYFIKCNLSRCNLTETNFLKSYLFKVKFNQSDLTKACLAECHLNKVSFNKALLIDVNMSYSRLETKFVRNIYAVYDFFGYGVFTIYPIDDSFNHYGAENGYTEVSTVKLKKCLQSSGLNLYKVDGILPSTRWLTAHGCHAQPISNQPIETNNNSICSTRTSHAEVNRFCLFKSKHNSNINGTNNNFVETESDENTIALKLH